MDSNENQEICCICLESNLSRNLDRMYTTCNHFFHKKCLYKAHKNDEKIKCCLCRVWQTIPIYEKDDIEWSHIDNDIKDKLIKINKAINFLFLGSVDYIIAGGFAVYTMQKLRGKSPSWMYSDIDVYIPENSEFFINNEKIDEIQELVIKDMTIRFNGNSYDSYDSYDDDKRLIDSILNELNKI